MATSKKPAAKKAAPVKRVYKKRVPKPKAEVQEVEHIVINNRTIKEWAFAKKWYIIGVSIVLIVAFVLFKNYQARYADRRVQKGVKQEQKPNEQLRENERLRRENDSLKSAVNAAQESAEKEADEVTKERVQYETQSTKKKEQTKVKYNETNQQIKEAVSSYDVDKLDAILLQVQRARKEVSDSSRIRAVDPRYSGRNKGNR